MFNIKFEIFSYFNKYAKTSNTLAITFLKWFIKVVCSGVQVPEKGKKCSPYTIVSEESNSVMLKLGNVI